MKKVSIKRFTVYGVALMSASAIVAFVLPSKAKQKNLSKSGMLVGNRVNPEGTLDGMTCITFQDLPGQEVLCTVTTDNGVTSSTTGVGSPTVHSGAPGGNNSFNDGNTTV